MPESKAFLALKRLEKRYESKMEMKERKNDPAVQQIIDRCLSQNFNVGARPKQKSIGEITDEMLKMFAEKSKVVDFAGGESCEFKGDQRLAQN